MQSALVILAIAPGDGYAEVIPNNPTHHYFRLADKPAFWIMKPKNKELRTASYYRVAFGSADRQHGLSLGHGRRRSGPCDRRWFLSRGEVPAAWKDCPALDVV